MDHLVKIRDYQPADKNFVYASWLRGVYYGECGFKDVPKNVFMEAYHNYVEKILDSPAISVKVACLREDESVILGYAVLSTVTPTLYFVFVKQAWRKIGIAKALVPNTTKVVTHLTAVGRSILKKHSDVTLNPFLNY